MQVRRSRLAVVNQRLTLNSEQDRKRSPPPTPPLPLLRQHFSKCLVRHLPDQMPRCFQKRKRTKQERGKKQYYFSLKGFDHRSDMQKLIPQTQLLMCRIHVWKREKAEIRQPAGIPSGFYFSLVFSFVEEAGVALRSQQSSRCVGRMYGGCLRDAQTRPFGC